MLEGGCYCGAVRYEAGGPPFHETLCHCSDCRHIAGAPSVAWFTVDRATFRYVASEPARFRSSAKATREFCGTCGTHLAFRRDDLTDEIDVTTASLDDPNALPPKDHTWAASKLAWVEFCDGLPVISTTRSSEVGARRSAPVR